MRSFFGLLIVICCSLVITGCGSSDGGISDWQKPAPVTVVSNIKGKILPPLSASLRPGLMALLSVEGATVFVEKYPEHSATTDSNGDFIIKNVPVGRHRLVAHKLSGTTPYRQRSDVFDLTGQFETQVINTPVTLEPAPYNVTVNVSDVGTDLPLNAGIRIWGFEFQAVNGVAEVGPFPGGVQSKEMAVSAVGYASQTFLVTFSDQRKAKLYVRLTPSTSTSGNRAPFAEIEHTASSVKTNESLSLSAAGVDADGDAITWLWSATAGTFSNQTGQTTIFTAPAASGSVDITLTGKDPDGATGRAVLRLVIEAGSSLPPNPNNRPPLAAYDPVPVNFSENQSDGTTLRWAGSDPDGDPITYDLLFAAQGSEMKVVAGNLSEAGYKVDGLVAFKTYFWQVITRDQYNAVTASPIWQFKTGDLSNFAPYVPGMPVPEDLSINQLPTTMCTWTGGDPDQDDIITYSLMFGTDQNSLQLRTKTRQTSMQLDNLELGKTYFWQIIAADNRGKETTGPVWRFSTHSPTNRNPSDPEAVGPASGAVGIAVNAQLRWNASDPDGDALTYDLFFGTTFPLAKVSSNQASQIFTPAESLKFSTRYFWQVVARDVRGLTNPDSPVWSFTTAEKVNQPPNQPMAISPASGSVNVPVRPSFAWSGGDIDDDAVTYDLFLDQNVPPTTKVAESLTATTWSPSVDLGAGKIYYWQIVARDKANNSTVSNVFSFTVKPEVAADLTPPEILSVSPANGAVEVAAEQTVTVVFSEAVDQTAALAAMSFSPAVSGAWAWDNVSTMVFRPTGGWPPGSFNRLVIADNTVKDKSNNIMSRGGSYGFTIASALPVPSSHRSVAFPRQVQANETALISVPDLPAGAKSFGVAVASPDAATFTLRASVAESMPAGIDPHSAFRFFEQSLSGHELPNSLETAGNLRSSSRLRASAVLGATEDFFIPVYGQVATSTSYPANKITARCQAISDQVIIYVDTAIQSPASSLVADVRLRFEDVIRPRVRDYFGEEPDLGPDGEGRLTVLLTDSMTTGIAGIFYGNDLFNRDESNIQLRESNARKIIYVKYSLASPITRFGTMAHEFQHMVNFYQKRRLGGSNNYEAVWLNEGLAKFSEEVCGYGILEGDANTASLVKLSQQNLKDLSLTNFVGLNSYGLSYLFVRFLAQENRYGTTYREITRKLIGSSLIGKANVASVTGEEFSQTLARWAMSLYLNRFSSEDPADYGLKSLNLAGTHNGVTLPGFNFIDVSTGQTLSLKPDAFAGFVKVSTGQAKTEFSLLNSGSNGFRVWLFDRRP